MRVADIERTMRTRATTVSGGSPQLFALAQGVWMAVTLVFLVYVAKWELELFFVLSFVGLLTVSHLFGPWAARPHWWRYVRLIVALCLLVFGYITVTHITAVLA